MARTGFSEITSPEQLAAVKRQSDSVIVMQPGQQSDLMRMYHFETLIAGEKGSGKAQRIDAKVATPNGFKEIGSLRVGSQVCNPDGTYARVIAIHPQGVKPIFRVRFSDGASTTATEDHLWLYRSVMQSLKGDCRYYPFEDENGVEGRIGTTRNLIDLLERNTKRGEKSMPNSIHVPSTKPVNFSIGGKRSWKRDIDPYVLGVLLGDGSLHGREAHFSSIDEEIVQEVSRKIFPRTVMSNTARLNHRISSPKPYVEALQRLGVYGKYSHEKFVPEIYKVAPVEVRMDVIRGLMDTDGTCSEIGACSFTSTSKQLALDMQWLIRSIGGVSSISSKFPTFTYKGEKKTGLLAYTVSIRTERDSELFMLSRKKARCRDSRGLPMMRTSRYITSIEPEGECEAVCISVDNPNQLYITDDFIVTHNSIASIVWLVRGNLDVPDAKKSQVDILYTNSPVYRAAVVRKNADDLNEWVENAKRVYGTKGDLLGATYTQQPREFTWPSGAKILCTHMADSDAYQRLTGQSLTRLFWDEITFEPDVNVYEKVYSSIRSTAKDLRAQILLACNPEGPGLSWVKERFVRFTDPTGRIYRPGEVMNIPVFDPISKATMYVTRIFLHWRLAQNRELLDNDPLYAARLATITNPSLRAAYLFGDFDAAGGKFFEFRRQRREEEPANACHVYDATKVMIQPWWPRLIGLDVGFSHYSAAMKIALSPDGRVWVIDELAHKGVGSREWGAILARWCVNDMAGLRKCGVPAVIPIFLSPDAIEQRRDAYGTWAEHIAEGIMSVFGPGSSEILSKEDTGDSDFDSRRVVQYESKMPLRRAMNKRVDGWNIMRALMEWNSVAEPDLSQYDESYARALADKDAHEYFRYQQEFIKKPEALPKLQISSLLRYLPDALESAVSSPQDLEDIAPPRRGNKDIVQLQDDVRDAARYGLAATMLFQQIKVPLANRVDDVLAEYPQMTDHQRFHAREAITKRLDKTTVKGFRIGRGANAGVYIT